MNLTAPVAVAKPARGAHRAVEADPHEDERHGEAEGVDEEEKRPLGGRGGIPREGEDGGEHRPDARGGADSERTAEEGARAAAAGSLDELRRDHAVEPGERQESHEGEAEDDDDHPRDHGEESLVVDEPAGRARQRAERHEDEREAGDEGDAGRHDLPPAHSDLQARDRGEVAGHEREHAGSDEGQEARNERERDFRFHD